MKLSISATNRFFLLCLSVLLTAGRCAAVTYTWTGAISSDWFAVGNWNPAGIPGASDTINFASGTINLTSPIAIGGTLNWSGGTLSGDSITVAGGGLMNIDGSVTLQNVISNAGTVTMTGAAYLEVYNNNSSFQGGIYNLAGALWDIETNASIASAGYGDEFFNNAGDFLRSLGSGTAAVGVNFTNTGAVTNLTAILSFSGGGSLAGVYDTAPGATIEFSGGIFTMGAPPLVSGSGLCEFIAGTLTLTENIPPKLVLAGGSLVLGPAFQGPGGITNLTLGGSILISTNTVAGTFTWNSGYLTGPITIASGGLMDIAGSVTLQNVISNAGTVTMTGAAYLEVYNNNSSFHGGIYNLAGALWNIETNASIASAGYGDEFFNNAGGFLRSLGSGTATVGVNFTNTGAVTNFTGILSFDGGGLLGGGYHTASGATVEFSGGNFTMSAPPLITGAGLCEFIAGTLTLTENVPPKLVLAGGTLVLGPAFQSPGGITNLTLSGSILISTNTVAGTFTWNSGYLASPITIASGGLMNITGSVTLQNVISNAGTVTMTGAAYLDVYNNNSGYHGGIYNLAGALWDIETNASIVSAGYGDEFFNNAGDFLRSLGSGTATVGVNFTNTGAVTNLTGILNFDAGGLLRGSYDTASGATIEFSGGNFTMGAPPLVTGSGLCEFIAGTLTLKENVPPALVLAGGSLVLGPAFQGPGGITNLTLSGSILISTNTVSGTFTWVSGYLASPITIASGGLMNIDGSVTLQNVISNAGTVTMTGAAYLEVYNNNSGYHGGIYNLAGALWDIETNASIASAGYGDEFFNNAGGFLRSLGSGTATVGVNFTNTGAVTNLTGTLNFEGGGLLSGGYDTASGATIEFSSGSFNMGVPPLISGSGLCELIGGVLTLTENVPPKLLLAGGSVVLGPAFQNFGGITNLTLSGSTLIGADTVTGTFLWQAGTITGPITIASGGLMNIAGSVYLQNVITNAGTVTLTGATYIEVFNNNATYRGGIYNLSGALWDIETNASISSAGYGYEYFNNDGNFYKSLSSGTAAINLNFTNAGTVKASAGTVSFNDNFINMGGTLGFGVSGLNSFGKINVASAVALNGTAGVTWLGGFLPAVGNSFAVLDYGSHSGTFANIVLPAGDTGQGNYGANVFSVSVVSVGASPPPPGPPLGITPLGATAILTWPASATHFTVESTTSLAPPAVWSAVSAVPYILSGQYIVIVDTSLAQQFFRLVNP